MMCMVGLSVAYLSYLCGVVLVIKTWNPSPFCYTLCDVSGLDYLDENLGYAEAVEEEEGGNAGKRQFFV